MDWVYERFALACCSAFRLASISTAFAGDSSEDEHWEAGDAGVNERTFCLSLPLCLSSFTLGTNLRQTSKIGFSLVGLTLGVQLRVP